jgi:hypothetical protein
MSCPEFEDLVREGASGHARHCEPCRALLEALADVDDTLDAAFAGVSAPPRLAASVRARLAIETPIRRPSMIPEVLDFIGWAAVLALAAVWIPHLLLRLTAVLAG